MNKKLLIASAAVALFAAGSAQAAVIQLTGVSGLWTTTNPSGPAVSGGGTNEIRWGTPANQQNQKMALKPGLASKNVMAVPGDQQVGMV